MLLNVVHYIDYAMVKKKNSFKDKKPTKSMDISTGRGPKLRVKVQDLRSNKMKSFTIYSDVALEEVFKKIVKALQREE